MKFIAAIALAIGLAFSGPAFSQATSPEVGATCDAGNSLQSFKDAVAKNVEQKVVILEGDNLQKFASAMDVILQGQHDPAIDAVAFVDPEGNKSDTTQLAIFKNGCLTGVVPFPTEIIKQAYGQSV